MHVLIAPDCFTGTLTATQAAEAMAEGWRRSAPHDLLTLMPLSDGGPGFIDVLAATLREGKTVLATAADPLGREVPATLLLVDGDDGTPTAYIESAQAAGLHLLEADERNPAVTSTWGVGQLLDAALREGAQRIVVGLGGSGTNDGGAGMLACLGAGPAGALARGGLALADLPDNALQRPRLRAAAVLPASTCSSRPTSTRPLLGFHGASAVFAPQKGATPEVAQALEGALGRFTEVVRRTVPEGQDLLSSQPRRLDREPGAGAAGGLGYGLLLLGGRRVSGVEEVLRRRRAARRRPRRRPGRDRGGLLRLAEPARQGGRRRRPGRARGCDPAVVIAGQTMVGRREAMTLGLSGTYAVAETPAQVEAAIADPVGTLAARAARVAATWSPRPLTEDVP